MTKSLYIHIPFCKKFCPYCDFVKCIYNNNNADLYVDKVINTLNKKYSKNKFKTIYIGGGTPNCLSDEQLAKLLKHVSKFLDKKYEFTIECNPEFVTNKQVQILYTNKINRVSLGVQTLDKKILKTINRLNHKQMVKQAIETLLKNKIKNISCDLIYGFNNQTSQSIGDDINFLIKNNVKHLSLYSLEIKDSTPWGKMHYQTDEYAIEDHLKYVIKHLRNKKFVRYEVSNWAKNKQYRALHNLLVWQTNDWAAIGLGAYGMENKCLYHYEGTINTWKLVKEKLSNYDLYFQVLMMGFRTNEGLNLQNNLHKQTYFYFKDLIDNESLIKKIKNKLIFTNVNLLDNFLIKLFKYEKK